MTTSTEDQPVTHAAAAWWAEPPRNELWNGVFQGGGAKGVAYAGALRAVADAGCWFRAVAGSSAGAITACLIAAGLTDDEMEDLSADGLATVRRVSAWRHMRGFFGGDQPLYGTDALRAWIERVLRAQVEVFTGAAVESDVTFGELYLATGIDLFVVLLDADAGVPIVLSHHNAAATQVAWAVVASSAIPLALPKQHLVVSGPAGEWQVRRIFDGGGWANYPRFVFADSSFRSFAGLPDADPDARTVGFVLQVGSQQEAASSGRPGLFVRYFERAGSKRPAERPTKRLHQASAAFGLGLLLAAIMNLLFAEEPLYSTSIGLWFAAASLVLMYLGRTRLGVVIREAADLALGARFMRLIFLGSVLLAFVMSLRALDSASGFLVFRSPEGEGGPAEMFSTTVGFFLMFALPFAVLSVLLVLAAILRFQRFLFLDAADVLGAVMGAATKVPLWAGHGPGDHLIFVPVDPPLATTDFEVDAGTRRAVIRNARIATETRVAELLAAPLQARVPPLTAPLNLADITQPTHSDLNPSARLTRRENIAGACAAVCGISAFFAAFLTYALYTNWRAGVATDAALAGVAACTAALAALSVAAAVYVRRARRQREEDERAVGQHGLPPPS